MFNTIVDKHYRHSETNFYNLAYFFRINLNSRGSTQTKSSISSLNLGFLELILF